MHLSFVFALRTFKSNHECQPLVEIKRRRTFAIISHPDAGKTTLTEKLLLFAARPPAAAAPVIALPEDARKLAQSDVVAQYFGTPPATVSGNRDRQFGRATRTRA